MDSPYSGFQSSQWLDRTRTLIQEFPLEKEELVEIVLLVWESILKTKIGVKEFRIGKDIFPKPQIMGFFLHELIPLELASRYPNQWRGEKTAIDKDIVYIPNDYYSIEIKTSSNPTKIFGNRSYAQSSQIQKKSKSGYYLAANFEKFDGEKNPKIRLIRFGWLDAEDWMGQKAASGQQARLSSEVESSKLMKLHQS